MYIQITQKCNFHCYHCAFACGPNGKHMTQKVFDAALTICESECVTIGGGEPTLHPHFWTFLAKAIAHCESVWMATNGSQTETALTLAKMAQKGVISCALSQDQYHDPIDPRVVEAFTVKKNPQFPYRQNEHDQREIRNVSSKIPLVVNNSIVYPLNYLAPFRNPENGGDPENCPCDDVIVTPSGKVRFCGCHNAPVIGDIFNGFQKPKSSEEYECWYQYQKALKE